MFVAFLKKSSKLRKTGLKRAKTKLEERDNKSDLEGTRKQ
jgi:hypothetical protein